MNGRDDHDPCDGPIRGCVYEEDERQRWFCVWCGAEDLGSRPADYEEDE